jgi:hypothetical protein
MKKIIRLTESDLTRIVRRVIMEQATVTPPKIKGLEIGTGNINGIGFTVIGDYMTTSTNSATNKTQPSISAKTTPWGKQQTQWQVNHYCDTKITNLTKPGGGQSFVPNKIEIPDAQSYCDQYRKYLASQPKK